MYTAHDLDEAMQFSVVTAEIKQSTMRAAGSVGGNSMVGN